MSCPRCQHTHFVKMGSSPKNSAINGKNATINGQRKHTGADPSRSVRWLPFSIAMDFP